MKQFNDERDYHDMFDDIFEKWNVTTFFQPIIDTRANRVYGIDATAWLQSKGSNCTDFISPHDFLTAAEKSGEIISITKELLLQIQDYLANHGDIDKCRELRFFIKISPLHLFSENIMEFAEDCIQTAKKLDKLNAKLVIEVNSRIPFDLIHKLKLLSALLTIQKNTFFALGDFGAGHSNIEMLFGFDFHYIKIDKSMFFPLTDKVIMHGFADDLMSGLSKQNTDIIVSGIDSVYHLQYFLNKNVSLFQGELFKAPVAYKNFNGLDYFDYG
ncbi:hypothetical protein Y71_23270 [Kosakonia radicincitans DSM 16656]|uniref:EAL domain-containing protein n=1 Tax=Kosakonia radicincitans TaxID=283686 RepID=UPI000272D7B7|nr:EAL domain-containing protein [Kosakonia radicincitans]ARD62689.1 hypothetical protein Y71_23270 [Kosakonia radicincitans DSM 16656]KDE37062.1 hypothetical protein AW40_08985 [Kosakonia radicincitans UMEnt01/12]